jgi:hypothetical protein
MVIVKSQPNLLAVIRTLHSPGGFSRGLYRRQQECHQDADNGNHYQQLNQRKTFGNSR